MRRCIGYVALRSPAPLPPLVNPVAVPSYSTRPDQNACEGRRFDAASNAASEGDGRMRRCIGNALGMWYSGYSILSRPRYSTLRLYLAIAPAPTIIHVNGDGLMPQAKQRE